MLVPVIAGVSSVVVAIYSYAVHRSSDMHISKKFPKKPIKENFDYDLIIVGAGVAGCAFAKAMHKDRKVLLIERDFYTEPDRIIGELMQPGGRKRLEALGLSHCTEGIKASPVKGYGVIKGSEMIHMPYPVYDKKDGLPEGRSFHYGKFIMNLRKTVENLENVTVLDAEVEKIEKKNGVVVGVSYISDPNTEELKQVRAPLTAIACGAGNLFTRQVNGMKPIINSTFMGVQLEDAADKLPFPQHGNVFLLPSGPCLCYPNSTTSVRMLIDFPQSAMPKNIPEYLRKNLVPLMPKKLQEPLLNAINTQKLKSVPNREMPARDWETCGVIMLGDSLSMRHPLTGSGMTAALTDVVFMKEALKGVDFKDYKAVDKSLKVFFKNRHYPVSTINILADALYAIFSPAFSGNSMTSQIMQDSIFEYFKMGEKYTKGPLGLLGAIIKSPGTLLYHYSWVALFAMWRQLFPIPNPFKVTLGFLSLFKALFIVGPLFAEERVFPFLFPPFIFSREQKSGKKKRRKRIRRKQ